MSGRLIILPKKSWNVWNAENIEKVKRDERLYQEDEEKKEKQVQAVEGERRIELLKKRKRQREETEVKHKNSIQEEMKVGNSITSNLFQLNNEIYVSPDNNIITNSHPPQLDLASNISIENKPNEEIILQNNEAIPKAKNINFFEEFEFSGRKTGSNSEYVKEQQKKKLDELKKLGIAPFELGEGSAERQKGEKPWYHFVPGFAPQKSVNGKVIFGKEIKHAEKRDNRRKEYYDPMFHILNKSNEFNTQSPEINIKTIVAKDLIIDNKCNKSNDIIKHSNEMKKNDKKKGEKKKKHKKESKKKDSVEDTKKIQLEHLRQARLQRERKELIRTKHFLSKIEPISLEDDRQRPYNSTFMKPSK